MWWRFWRVRREIASFKKANILHSKMFVARRPDRSTDLAFGITFLSVRAPTGFLLGDYVPITCLAHCTISRTRGDEIS